MIYELQGETIMKTANLTDKESEKEYQEGLRFLRKQAKSGNQGMRQRALRALEEKQREHDKKVKGGSGFKSNS